MCCVLRPPLPVRVEPRAHAPRVLTRTHKSMGKGETAAAL